MFPVVAASAGVTVALLFLLAFIGPRSKKWSDRIRVVLMISTFLMIAATMAHMDLQE